MLLRPLRFLGIQSDQLAGQMLLTLHVTPIVKDEGTCALSELKNKNSKDAPSGFPEVTRNIHLVIESMLNRMLDRIESMALASATGASPLPDLRSLPGFTFSLLNVVAIIIFVGFIVSMVSV